MLYTEQLQAKKLQPQVNLKECYIPIFPDDPEEEFSESWLEGIPS